MPKTITISDELAKRIVDFCEDELNYHINESGCADEYDSEIKAQVELLDLLGYSDRADKYRNEYQSYLDENGFGVNSDGTPWYDWWNDVDGYLLNVDPDFKDLMYNFAETYGIPTDDSDLADKLGYTIRKYVQDNAESLGIDPTQQDDQVYTEFAFERILPMLLDESSDFWDEM